MTGHGHFHLKYRTRYFAYGVTFALLTCASVGYATKWRADEVEIGKLRQAQAVSQEVLRVKAFYQAKNPKLWDSLALELASATVDAARFYQVPLDVQVAVNTCESEASPFAQSPTGAKGLGQVDFDAWKEELGQGNPYEPRFNQRGTAYILAVSIQKHGLKKGLEIYNLGEGNYRNGKRNRQYVLRVFEQASEFRYMTL